MTNHQKPANPPAEVLAVLDVMRREIAEAPWIGNPQYSALSLALRAFAPLPTISAIAGLQTVPAHQTAAARLELLTHLATLHCRGKKVPTRQALRGWVNRDLAQLPIRRVEDPPEDVFVSNVMIGGSNCRVFEGVWESSDYYLQHVLDCIGRTEWGRPFFRLRARVRALLLLSDAVAERAGLQRWAITNRDVPADEILGPETSPSALSKLVTFDRVALEELDVSSDLLEPFVFAPARRAELANESTHDSTLIRHPVAMFGDRLVLALPTAVSAAIRHYILDWAEQNKCTEEFRHCLQLRQLEAALEVAPRRIDAPASITRPGGLDLSALYVPTGVIGQSVVAIDTDKLAHIVLLEDDLSAIRRDGVGSTSNRDPYEENVLRQHVEDVARQLRLVASGGGLTIVVQGGLGRGATLTLPGPMDSWHALSMSLADFDMFASSEDASLLRLWKLHEQVELLEQQDYKITNLSGELNLYAYWQQTDFLLIPASVPYPHPHSHLSIGTNHLYHLRVRERRNNDLHLAIFDGRGKAAEVRRLHTHPFFSALSNRPIFGAEELARRGELVGVVESSLPALWIWMARPAATESVLGFAHDIWDATLTWMDRLLPAVHRSARWSDDKPDIPMRITLHLDDVEAWQAFSALSNDQVPERPRTMVTSADRAIDVHLPFGFCALLRRPTNDGERALLEEVVVALFSTAHSKNKPSVDVAEDRSTAQQLVAECLAGDDARALHLFAAQSIADVLAPVRPPIARVIQEEDSAFWVRGLAWRALDQPRITPGEESNTALVITDVAGSGSFLNKVVDRLWRAIKTDLAELNGPSLVEMLIGNTEAILWDRQHWQRTARAIAGFHGSSENITLVSARRESDRARAAHASRVLVEMAICASRSKGGRPSSLSKMDRLVAAVGLLVELASDSDAIRGGFAKAEVRVFLNGAIACDEDFLRSVVTQYGIETHSNDFREAIGRYDDLFKTPDRGGESSDADEAPDASFREAFLAEFGITTDRFISGLAELFDLAHQEKALCVSTTREVIKTRLADNRRFSPAEAEAFAQMMSLVPRPHWDETPSGYTPRDWYPWRFRRRLSVVARPLVCVGDTSTDRCVYGVHQLGASVSYLFGAMREAWLPEEYFVSDAMQRFRGARANAIGHKFTREVGADLQSAGYEVRIELEMSWLGASAEFGDLDVVAWRYPDPHVWLIECKKLLPARTVGEIVERLRQFRGESDDLLAKHLRRVEWVQANAAGVSSRLGLSQAHVFIPILSTNIPVPMQFVSELPLPSKQITTRDRLVSTLERLASEG